MIGTFSAASPLSTASGREAADAESLLRLLTQHAGQPDALASHLLDQLRREVQSDAARLWLRSGSETELVAESGLPIPLNSPIESHAPPRFSHSVAAPLTLSELASEELRSWGRSQRLSHGHIAPVVQASAQIGQVELLARKPLDQDALDCWLPRLALVLDPIRLQRQAASAEEFAYGLLRHTPVAVVGIDVGGVVRLWNPAAEALYGWSAAAAVSQRPRFVPQSHRREADELWQRLLSGKPVPRLDTIRLRSDGAAIPIVLSAVPQFDHRGNVTGVVELHQDATPLARTSRRSHFERRLREIMDRSDSVEHGGTPILQTLCEMMDWGAGELWTVDEQRNVLQSVAACRSTSRAENVPLSREVKPGSGLAGRIWNSCEPLYMPVVDDESGRGSSPALSRSGFGLPILHRNRVIGVLTFCEPGLAEPTPEERDILQTVVAGLGQFLELKQTQLKLAQTEAKLRQAQKMDAVGLLAGGIAHDFNNVLTVILSYSEIAGEEVEPEHPAHEMLAEIYNAGQRAASMTRKLLTFSRQQGEELVVLDLNRMVGDMERMLRRLIGPNIELQTDLLDGLGAIRGDASQIDQVLVNFVVNARDAMQGAGRITIETRHASFTAAQAHEIPGARSGDYVVLRVTDNGCGMDESTKARIFEPFFTTKGVGRGTGMGLATVAGIIRQAGGFIKVETVPGAGTSMIVHFPRVRQALATQSFDTRPEVLPQGHETVLVVEEDEIIRTLMRRVVATRGYRVLEASDADAALQLIRAAEHPVSLVLTNLAMPGLGGHQLAARLNECDPSIRVIFVVGSSEDQLLAAERAEVATLNKPFTSDALARKIRAVLDE